jgi:hypothetical protein
MLFGVAPFAQSFTRLYGVLPWLRQRFVVLVMRL